MKAAHNEEADSSLLIAHNEEAHSNKRESDSAFDKFCGYFLILVLGLFLGHLWAFIAYSKNDERIDPRQMETQVKNELLTGPGVPFRIAGTNMEITPWRDGSGVVRIKED